MSVTEQKRPTTKRETWGSLRKLPSGRWQARYPAPDGEIYTARTDDDKPLTFLTKTDARTWLAGAHTKIARGDWQPPSAVAARRRAEAAADQARAVGFSEYSERWLAMIRTEPNRSGKKRAVGTVRSYQSKVTGYLVPEFENTPIRDIDEARIRVMTERLDKIPSPLNPRSKFNGVTRPVLIVLMMILRQAARDGITPAAPNVSIPRQEPVRHDADHDAKTVGDHHPGGCAQPNGDNRIKLRRQRDGGQLCFVAHFSDEKSDGDGPERAELVFFCFIPQFIAADGPDAEQNEGKRGADLDR